MNKNIDTTQRYKAAITFQDELNNNSYLSDFNISLSYVNYKKASVFTLSTNYDWHLEYWDKGLDGKLPQRTLPGIHNWRSYDKEHRNTLEKCTPGVFKKIDICTQHNMNYELLSFSSHNMFSFLDIQNFIELKPRISALARKIWNKNLTEMALPIRSHQSGVYHQPENKAITLREDHAFQFGDITLTPHEMKSIELLLQLKSIKEIAKYHHCSVDVEKKRIINIKRKLHCEGMSLSCLFSALRKNGVLFSCMVQYITCR